MDEETALRYGRSDLELGTTTDHWAGFSVVRFHGRERLGELYEFDITVLRKAVDGPADLDALLGSPATFLVASQSRWRHIHGILADVEELDRTREVFLYRFKLVPPIWRAKHRMRCRTFVYNTLEEIITTVLENRATVHGGEQGGLKRRAGEPTLAPAPSFDLFTPPSGAYRLAVTDQVRLQDRSLRNYVVQYNETDFDFLSRILEEEGLSYYFEHEEARVVMTITDRPAHMPVAEQDSRVPFQGTVEGGGPENKEAIQQLRRARRMRSEAVTLRDWDELRPQQPLEGSASASGADPEQVGRMEFPGRDEGVDASPDRFPAQVRLERFAMERQIAEARTTVRVLEPGLRFIMTDSTGFREDEEFVVVAVETYATQMLPEGLLLDDEAFGFTRDARQGIGDYENRVELLPATIVFRPAMKTPRPRVDGVQSAIVTAEEVESDKPEIHCDPDGYLRLRFPWDQRREAGRPSSVWIRCSQGWAGAGFGMMHIPRVGQEVLVAYYQGDIERPVIVGRVYNPIEPVPYELPARKTVSTVKSQSSPGGDGSNELRFEDKKGDEEVYLHAQRNLNEVVEASHSCSVGGDQSYGIGGKQTFDVKSDLIRRVGGDRRVTVTGNHATKQANYDSTAGGHHAFSSKQATFTEDVSFAVHAPLQTFRGANASFDESGSFSVSAGGATLTMAKGNIVLDNGAGCRVMLTGGKILITAGSIAEKSSSHLIDSKKVDIIGKETIDGIAAQIRLNG